MRLFRCLRNAIIDSVLAPKTRLPASRDLAKEIQVSRNTVLNAYEQLQAGVMLMPVPVKVPG